MKNRLFLTSVATAVLALGAPLAFGQSGESAQIIFTNDKLTVIDAKGVERVAKQGDFIQPGERVLTAPGVIGQIKLPDGTLLGARPGTDLKLESIVAALGKNVLVLNEGNLRVINVEAPKGAKPMPVEVVSPVSTMQLTGGDGEAIHVKSGGKQGVEPGTYNRLQSGNAIVRNDKGEAPLPPLQPIFAQRLGVPLQPISALPVSLVRIEPVLATNNLLSPTLTTAPLSGDLKTLSPTLTTSVLTSPTLAPLSPLPIAPLGDPSLKTSLGTVAPTGTSTPALSPTLTSQYTIVNTTTLNTAIKLQPPPPPPPPPPKTITCTKCLILR